MIDDLEGYSVRHSLERERIYIEQQFEILPKQRVKLSNFK